MLTRKAFYNKKKKELTYWVKEYGEYRAVTEPCRNLQCAKFNLLTVKNLYRIDHKLIIL
jgi:hypothetical protein